MSVYGRKVGVAAVVPINGHFSAVCNVNSSHLFSPHHLSSSKKKQIVCSETCCEIMDCLGSAQIAGVCGIWERFQYFYFRRVSHRCVDKSQITVGPPIATPPSCLADGHWWFQFLPYVASTLRRVLRTDFSAAALAVVFGSDRFGANIITSRLALLWFPNPNSTVRCSVLRFFWIVPASFFLFASPPLTFICVSLNQIYPLTHLSPGRLLSQTFYTLLLHWSSYMSLVYTSLHANSLPLPNWILQPQN